ncbi:MATE family efflux transporter [Tepiditoga spiralis]|uniref:Multidrug-efflux transporter n=1 Tax=Tepiditoga spiralis TaxID=2108365 RepID=A0A7G1G1B2_9BACT|nr:MATE family efflux transporter [Tepiditoga spiralis]BBE29930.1 MATE family efflux transporter [Tepiditoga spiralis]
MSKKYFKVLKIALPAVGEMLLYMLVFVSDTAFIGHWGGNDAVSAVGLSTELIYTITGIIITIGLSTAITTMVAQSYGAKKINTVEKYLSSGFFFGFFISLIVSTFIFLFSKNILIILGAKKIVLSYGLSYTKIVAFGSVFQMLVSLLSSGLRGIGNTFMSMISALIINTINIILDWIFIFGKFGFPEMGVKGAAIATSLAAIIGFLFLVFYYVFFSKVKIRFKYIKNLNKKYILKLFYLAVPSGLQEGAFSLARLLSVSWVLSGLGKLSASTNQIVTTIESISFMPGWGFSVAATALVGQMIGAKDYKKAKEYANISALMGTVIMSFFGILFILIPKLFMNFFITDPKTIELGVLCLIVTAFEQPTMAISMIYGGSLKGAGDTKTPFKVSLFTNWGIRLPLIFIIIFILKLNLVYVWGAMVIQWFIDALLKYNFFKNFLSSKIKLNI